MRFREESFGRVTKYDQSEDETYHPLEMKITNFNHDGLITLLFNHNIAKVFNHLSKIKQQSNGIYLQGKREC